MGPKVKKTLKIISDVLLVLVLVLLFLLHGFKLFGLTPYTVLSGSMQSVYPTGSLIYVKDVDPAKLEVNDTITFRLSGETIVTHRIVELVPDETDPDTVLFRTKGDENDVVDGTLVEYGDVIGQPLFCIPMLGYLAVYIAQPPGRYVALCFALALVLIEIMISILIDDKKEKQDHKEKQKHKEETT